MVFLDAGLRTAALVAKQADGGGGMGKAMRKPWSVADFVAWEDRQAERYEFVDGVVRVMTGGTAR